MIVGRILRDSPLRKGADFLAGQPGAKTRNSEYPKIRENAVAGSAPRHAAAAMRDAAGRRCGPGKGAGQTGRRPRPGRGAAAGAGEGRPYAALALPRTARRTKSVASISTIAIGSATRQPPTNGATR